MNSLSLSSTLSRNAAFHKAQRYVAQNLAFTPVEYLTIWLFLQNWIILPWTLNGILSTGICLILLDKECVELFWVGNHLILLQPSQSNSSFFFHHNPRGYGGGSGFFHSKCTWECAGCKAILLVWSKVYFLAILVDFSLAKQGCHFDTVGTTPLSEI